MTSYKNLLDQYYAAIFRRAVRDTAGNLVSGWWSEPLPALFQETNQLWRKLTETEQQACGAYMNELYQRRIA